MLSGDNGILQKATDAKTNTDKAQIVENAKIDILAQIAENKGENISKEQLKTILNKYFENITTLELPDDLSNSDIKLTANQTYGSYPNIALVDIYNGKLIISEQENTMVLASEKLLTNPLAETDSGKSPYVLYNGIVCRVLYDSTSPYGIEIISNDVIETNDTIETVLLGYGDTNPSVTSDTLDTQGIKSAYGTIDDNTKKSAVSYNRAVTTLNEKAENYIIENDGIIKYARCVGSNPSHPEDIVSTEYAVNDEATNKYIKTRGCNNKFKVEDNNYEADLNQMQSLGIDVASSDYWLASRRIVLPGSQTAFCVRLVSSTGALSQYGLFKVDNTGMREPTNPGKGFRPVFHLESGIKIIDEENNDGSSSEKPYLLSK